MGRSWHERGTYGNILKDLINKQLAKYAKERNRIRATKIFQNIGYLIQVQSGMIKDHQVSLLENRVEEVERKVGIRA